MAGLSQKTEEILARVFPEEETRRDVRDQLIRECGNGIPFCKNSNPEDLERIRFSVLKLSEGDLDKLRQAIGLANCDWRDLFMDAGFGQDIEAHMKWYEQMMGPRNAGR